MVNKNTIYGIDLGTTNSLIGCNNRLLTRLVSSKVDMMSHKTVPQSTIGHNVIGSYKIDMSLGDEGDSPIKASSIVLEELVNIVKRDTGDDVKDVIISVPAYFSSNQRMAVRLAANKVGLNLINVINEPTAAAIQICSKKGMGTLRRSVFVVYDLGGGTFDCTVIDSRSGKYNVVATDGCILGGDDLDRSIANKVLEVGKISIYKRNEQGIAELIDNCRIWKLKMQQAYSDRDKTSINIEIPTVLLDTTSSECITHVNFGIDEYMRLVKDTFSKTVSILTHLIDSKIAKGTDYTVVFVGGSTHDTFLCSHILEVANIPFANAEFDDDPDFTVALGVIKYATDIQNGKADIEFRDVTKQLSIADSNGRAVTIVSANTNIPCVKKKIVTNSNDTEVLRVKLYQGNSVLECNNEYIGYLEFKYDMMMLAGTGDVEVTVSVDTGGFITLEVEDIVNFGVKQLTVLRGF